uniref:uncharacterized protein LOC131109074 isoform X1 n=1 Tax=Doryrhamphus excisus TaxID=161450 RepID=UPI0025ADC3DD|nr:uncharacterized protein LOC131109074 isoform X1 [Doryrhamphus excisus]XP_057916626.1 uncharacterized protein LOC131109074 isoform X1 [Doryrhamphus excisus]XP_057916627.1 uncharacterized protein LOC131109074 isoform X1 [Doryrhamphus excisus]
MANPSLPGKATVSLVRRGRAAHRKMEAAMCATNTCAKACYTPATSSAGGDPRLQEANRKRENGGGTAGCGENRDKCRCGIPSIQGKLVLKRAVQTRYLCGASQMWMFEADHHHHHPQAEDRSLKAARQWRPPVSNHPINQQSKAPGLECCLSFGERHVTERSSMIHGLCADLPGPWFQCVCVCWRCGGRAVERRHRGSREAGQLKHVVSEWMVGVFQVGGRAAVPEKAGDQ